MFLAEQLRLKAKYRGFEKAALDDSVQLVSVDVFDTLLLRNLKPEAQRFLDISRRWKAQLEQHHPGISGKSLFESRLLAAKLAYRTAKKVEYCREANHADILSVILKAHNLDKTLAPSLCESELDYELTALEPNPVLVKLLQQCKDKGKRVIAISDMYLTAEQIGYLVENKLPPAIVQKIYSSAEFGIGKAAGGLYRQIGDLEKINDRSDWVHCGDNYRADYQKAIEHGIRAFHTPRTLDWRVVCYLRRKFFHARMGLQYL